MRTYITCLLIIFLIPVASTAQFNFNNGQEPQQKPKVWLKPDIDINVGAAVGTGFNKMYWFNNYVNPVIKLKINNKLTLFTSTCANVSYVNNVTLFTFDNKLALHNFKINSFFIDAGGIYTLTNKFDVLASVKHEQFILHNIGTKNYQFNYSDVSLGFNYKPIKNFQFNATVNFTNRPYSYFDNIGLANSFTNYYW